MQSNEPGFRRDEPSVWRELGLPEPNFEEGDGPPLSEDDRRDLRAFLRNTPLPEDRRLRVNRNLGRYRSWSHAAVQAALERAEEAIEEGDAPPLTPADFERLAAYLKNELTDEEDEQVAELIERYRSWRRASDAIRRTIP